MKILKWIGVALISLVLICITALFVNEKLNERVTVTEYSFSHEEVPKSFDGYKILLISDLHEAPFSRQIIKHIKKEKPDMVVMTGDMVQLPGHSLKETVKIGKAIDDIPIYAVTGNHDTQCGYYDDIIKTLWESDIIPLDNDSVCIERGEESFLLLGIKDPTRTTVTDEMLEEIRSQIESEFPDGPCFSILLSHRADLYPDIKNTSADLILSGHLHGGIARLPFVGGLRGKKGENSLFPEYEYGMYEDKEAASMIVSGGCDKNPQKKRYFNPPEVVLITLRSEGSQKK